EGRFDVDVHDLVPARLGEALEGFAPRGTGVVDEDVEAFLARLKLLGERAAAFDGRKIDGQADDLARIARLEIGDGFLDLRTLARRDIDACRAGGEIALDDHLADSARAAGDERDAAVEAEHVIEVHCRSPIFPSRLREGLGVGQRRCGRPPRCEWRASSQLSLPLPPRKREWIGSTQYPFIRAT